MTDDNCTDCGLTHRLHFREDGIYGCPGSGHSHSHESLNLRWSPDGATTSSLSQHTPTLQGASVGYPRSYVRSDSPDPLLLGPKKQLRQHHRSVQRRSTQFEDVSVPLRRSARLENQRRTRESAEPYAQAQARRSSLRMDGDAIRHSRPHRMSLQDGRRFFGHSHENEAIFPSWNNFSQRFRRKSLQTHVLDRMVPVEDMDPFEGFQPFTTLEPGHQAAPVTVRELTKDLPKPPFEYAWKPSVTFPEIGGMRVRVGRFERSAHFAKDTTPSVRYPDSPGDGNESSFEDSGSEGYFTAQDWTTPSITSEGSTIGPFPHVITPPPSLPQPDFIQGSSNSVLPFKTQSLTSGLDHRHPSIMGNDNVQFPHLEELLQHYAAVQREEKWVSPLQQTGPPCHVVEPTLSAPAPALRSPATFEHPEGSIVFHPQRGSCDARPLNDPSTLTGPLRTEHPRRSIMPGTLPGTKIVDYRSDSTPSFADRITEAAVDECEDWAAREPWEYIHRVLTSSTYPLVVFLKMPTVDIPAAALGVLGADLHLQKMLIDNEHWLLIGPRDVNLHEFGVKFQTRARTPEKFVFRFGNLNWGADVNQIEDEVCKAVIECSNRGRGMPATLPAQFMAGAIGGFVVWYALSLM